MSPALQRDRSIHKVFTASATKGADGTNVFTLSTDELDRDRDRIDQRGWDLSAYRRNPVVLYGHAHSDLPIGKCTNIAVVGGKLKGTIAWPPPGCYPFADTVRGLVNAGFLRSASVGFTVDDHEPNGFGGHDIKRATLLEWSVVNIPSNPSALMERGVDKMRLKSWLGHSWREQQKEDEMDTEMWLEIDDGMDTKDGGDDAFREMCASMLAAYSEFGSDKFRELMEHQLSTLGPLGTIADLVRGLMQQGVPAMRSFHAHELFEIDEQQLTTLIGQVIAEEVGASTRSALNQALGRLD